MEINLENQILMLDEAHNIEDSARDSVSGSFDIEDIVFAMQVVLYEMIIFPYYLKHKKIALLLRISVK